MAGGFGDYLAECLGEVPSAFRRGMIVVTILANILVVAALYLGWHLNAFTALQLASAGVLIAVLEVLVIFPYRLWKANKSNIAELNQRLTVLAQERPFSLDNAQFETYLNKKAKTCNITVVVNFMNSGERLLEWRLLSYSIEANGRKLTAPAATSEYFVNRGQRAFYNYPTLQNVPFNGWPVTVDLMFDCEYDNVPPILVRRTKRIVRYVLPGLVSNNVKAFDVLSEER